MVMGKFKPKPTTVKVKGKGKRWRKGHSSDSNPEGRKHRNQAKNRFFNVQTGPSNLTQEALAKHDKSQDSDDDESMGDAHSLSGKTFNTWATNWTECTNATFSKVHRYWHSNSAMHKEILAVLAAITEVIKQQGGEETETEYFGALITTLNTVEGEESRAAVVYLLSLAIKRVPVAVLKSTFSHVSKTLVDVLAENASSDTPSLVRSLLVCLASLLRVQDRNVWSNSSTMQVYNAILAFVVHPKPKVRKAAQQSVRVILKTSAFMVAPQAPSYHPAAVNTAKFCIQQIEQCGGGAEATGTLHILELLRDILHVLPHNSLKSACETILRVMTLSNVLISSVAMRAFYGMFTADAKASNLPADLNAQLITALYDFQPGKSDVQPLNAWLTVMEKAHSNLSRLDEQLCLNHLPRLFNACMSCLLAEKPEALNAAASTLQNLLRESVGRSAEKLGMAVKLAPSGSVTPLHKMFRAVEAGLSYQYHAAWGHILKVLNVFYEILGKHCYSFMKKSLSSMAELRDSHQFAYKVDLDRAVGMAVRVMGPKRVLEAIPLLITGEDDDLSFPRSWLLPMMKDNIRDTEVEFFTTYFLPLAAKLRTQSSEHGKQGNVVQGQTYDTLQMQVWALLPGFCTRPTDIKQSFKGIAKILGSALQDREDLRSDVMLSIRKLISANIDNDENRTELGKFAKNFLPLLFNLFTTEVESEGDKSRLAVLETIKTYMQIADTQLLGHFFDKCNTNLTDQDLATFKRHALLDLMMAMVPHLDEKRLGQLYQYVSQHLESDDRTVQKKCYRILEELCAGTSDNCKKFVQASVRDLQTHLLKSLSASAPSSKAPRLRCLVHMLEHLDQPQLEFIMAVTPEAILCTREVAERARMASYNLLVSMGKTILRWHPDQSKEESIKLYFELVLAGLAGSPLMVSTTVLALTRILIEFKDSVNSELMQILVENTCVILRSKAREVVSAALGLLKVILAAFPNTDLAQFLQDIVSSLVSMKEDNRHHFRFKAKEIFTRLIRKFGFETVQKMVPESMHKMLANIKKTQERVKRKKKTSKDEEEEESDEEEEAMGKSKPESFEELLRDTDSELEEDESKSSKGKQKKDKKKAQKGAAWLKEGQGHETDIIDFLDQSVAKKVLATKPEVHEKKDKDDHGFKMAPDGRFIIREEGEKEKPAAKPGAVIDNLDELLDAMDHHSKRSRKRKIEPAIDDEDDDEKPSKYQAGGSGIHRPIAVAKKKKAEEKELGAEYQSKHARGDMKKKGKPDPYAYVPLEFKMLNKRKRAKATGQFKNLVRGAKKGASKGSKQRNKKSK